MDRYTRTIIVADNDELVRSMLRSALTVFGYNVITATDGEEVFKLFQRFQSDVRCLILAESMPRTSGAATATKIRSLERSLPIIITTSNRLESRSIFSADRAITYLCKPFDLEIILDTIDTMIRRSRIKVA